MNAETVNSSIREFKKQLNSDLQEVKELLNSISQTGNPIVICKTNNEYCTSTYPVCKNMIVKLNDDRTVVILDTLVVDKNTFKSPEHITLTVEEILEPEDFIVKGALIAGRTLIKYFGDEEDVKISSKVYRVGDYAFLNNKTIKTLSFSQTTRYIMRSAFENCENLNSVTLTDNLTDVADFAFKGCHSLKQLDIDVWKQIDADALQYYTNISGTAFDKEIQFLYKGRVTDFVTAKNYNTLYKDRWNEPNILKSILQWADRKVILEVGEYIQQQKTGFIESVAKSTQSKDFICEFYQDISYDTLIKKICQLDAQKILCNDHIKNHIEKHSNKSVFITPDNHLLTMDAGTIKIDGKKIRARSLGELSDEQQDLEISLAYALSLLYADVSEGMYYKNLCESLVQKNIRVSMDRLLEFLTSGIKSYSIHEADTPVEYFFNKNSGEISISVPVNEIFNDSWKRAFNDFSENDNVIIEDNKLVTDKGLFVGVLPSELYSAINNFKALNCISDISIKVSKKYSYTQSEKLHFLSVEKVAFDIIISFCIHSKSISPKSILCCLAQEGDDYELKLYECSLEQKYIELSFDIFEEFCEKYKTSSQDKNFYSFIMTTLENNPEKYSEAESFFKNQNKSELESADDAMMTWLFDRYIVREKTIYELNDEVVSEEDWNKKKGYMKYPYFEMFLLEDADCLDEINNKEDLYEKIKRKISFKYFEIIYL